MSEVNHNKNILSSGKLTIACIAEELGVSKTTVSRAISGKGRIGKETVQKVMECIEKYNYKPNSIAKGLADSKTYNIGVAFPADTDFINTPFFQVCLLGICEVAAALDYDVVVTTVKETDINLLRRLVEHNKVDGVVLTRNLDNDVAISYLRQAGIPFVLVGSSEDNTLVQIDNNHMEACEKLVSLLIANGVKDIAMIMGDRKHMVNRYRCEGYLNALRNNGIAIDQDLIFTDSNSSVFVEQAVHNILKRKAECIVCTDDVICGRVMAILREEGYSVPEDIKVASFYDSVYMKTNNPPVTAIGFDAEELGTIAGKRLIGLIGGDSNTSKTVLDYEIHLRRSTK
jgi:DNA-binding LacI/PurR family transcriptional regulator